jgi:1-acyl-sn-glycerol-3-phosphate acyltransferase
MTEATSDYWKKLLDLNSQVPPDFLEAYKTRLSILRPVFYGIIGFLCRLYCRVETYGLNNLPDSPPYILAPNHVSALDQTVVSYVIGAKRRSYLYTIASKHFFDIPIFRIFMKIAANVVRIDREEDFFSALKTAVKILKLKRSVYINPEGTRSKTGELLPFTDGVGVLAVETNVPIVPVYIEGTYKSLKPGTIIPKPHKVKVFFGKPIYMDKYIERLKSEQAYDVYKAVTDELFERVSLLKVGNK